MHPKRCRIACMSTDLYMHSVYYSLMLLDETNYDSYFPCTPEGTNYSTCACAKGLSNQFCPSASLFVCLFVSLSGEKFLNLNIDRVKRFPKLTVALTL